MEVDDHAVVLLDVLHGELELLLAVALEGAEHLGGEAGVVDADRDLIAALDVAEADGDGLGRDAAVHRVSVPPEAVEASVGGEFGLGDELGVADGRLVEGHGVDRDGFVLWGLRGEVGHGSEDLPDRRRRRAVAVHVSRASRVPQRAVPSPTGRSATRIVVRIPRARGPSRVEAAVAVSPPGRDAIGPRRRVANLSSSPHHLVGRERASLALGGRDRSRVR